MNDVLDFLDILHPSNFGCLGGNWTFSTPTPGFNSYRFSASVAYANMVPWRSI
jgi:hypothetical protein